MGRKPKARRRSSPPPLRQATAAAAEEVASLPRTDTPTDAEGAALSSPHPTASEQAPNEPSGIAEATGAPSASNAVDPAIVPVSEAPTAVPSTSPAKASPPLATPKAAAPVPVVSHENCLLDLIIAGEAVPAK